MPLHKRRLYIYIKMGCVEVNKKIYRSVSIGEPLKNLQSPIGWQKSEMVKISAVLQKVCGSKGQIESRAELRN